MSDRLDILGLGMSILDSIQIVEDFPATGGVSRVIESRLMGGGPVPTALCAASRLGARTAVIDRVGDDWRGELIRRDYEKFGVATDFLVMEGGKRSSFATVLVRQSDGERHIVFEEGDFAPFAAEELPGEALGETSILHLNGRHWPACVHAAHQVRAAGGRVSFDGGAHRFDEKFLELLRLVDVLIVARDFAENFAKSSDTREQLVSLSRWKAEVVGITDGERGSDWFVEGEHFHQPAFPVKEVVDTTGCGDVFHGAFLFALSRGDEVNECARFASATAALSARALGGRGKLPNPGEVEELMAKYQG